MEDINLRGKITVITGPPDSGKSNLVKYLLTLPAYRRHLVYDPMFGFDAKTHNVIRPPNNQHKYRRYEKGNEELNHAADKFVLSPEKSQRPSYFVVDEAGRLLPNQKDEGPAIGEINDFNAHYGIGLWVVGQRLAQINSDLENKAVHHFVCGYMGKNDKQTLRQYHEDAPEALDNIKSQDPFGFIYIGANGQLRQFKSVPEVGSKGQL
jgi:hypothetical protein